MHDLNNIEDFGDHDVQEQYVSSEDNTVPPVTDFHVHEEEMKLLREEIQKLKVENICLKKSNLAFETVIKNNQLCNHYTGYYRQK